MSARAKPVDVVFYDGPVDGKPARLAGAPFEVIVWTHNDTLQWRVEEPGRQLSARWRPSRYRRTETSEVGLCRGAGIGMRRIYVAVTVWGR